jgi:hypothetical protein
MTAPVVQARDTQTAAARSGATVWTLNLGTLVEGDLIIGFFTISEDISDTSTAWTVAHNGSGAAAEELYDNGVDFFVIAKVVEASDVSTLTTITSTSSASRRKAAIFYRISDHTHGTNATSINARVQGSSTNPDPGSVTATTSGLENLFLALCGNPVVTAGAITPTVAPSGYSNLQTAVLDSTKDCFLGSAEKAVEADSDNPGTFTLDTSHDWTALTLCIQGTAATGGATILPGLISSDELFFNPTLVAGSVNITPNLITSNEVFFNPTLTWEEFITPSLIASSETFYSPGITVGDITISPSLITSGETFNSPTLVTGSVTITPNLIASDETFYSHVVSEGTLYIIDPTLIDSEELFYGSTISTGSVTLVPTFIDSEEVFYSVYVDDGTGVAFKGYLLLLGVG